MNTTTEFHCRGVGAAENTSRPYRGHCRGGQKTAPTEAPSIGTSWEWRLAQPPYRSFKAAPTVNFCSNVVT